MQQALAYIQNPANQFGMETLKTVQLAVLPILLALIISIPLGIVLAPRPIPAFVAMNFAGLVRAVPTLAVLAFVVTYLGIGYRPSVFALSLLGVPPILVNTITGLNGIDPATVESARGMGMTRWQILSRIQLPLIAPVLAAGVRTAAVQIVATVPIAALAGGGGYGDYILYGVSSFKTTPLLVGAVGIAVFTFLTEMLLALAQRVLTPRGLRYEPAADVAVETPGSDSATGRVPLAA